MTRIRLAVALQLVFVAALYGCAAGRSVVTVTMDAGRNPEKGTAVRIQEVTDLRRFMVRPPSADMPSLMEDNEIHDKAITSRAVGRKRGGFGNALGDVVLQEGMTVQKLVEAATARAFRESGYRVLDSGDPGHAQAVPVSVRIDQFWSWFSPGFAAVTVSFRGVLFLKGDVPPIANGKIANTQVQEQMAAVFEDDWKAIVQKGLNDLVVRMKDVLQPASQGSLRPEALAASR